MIKAVLGIDPGGTGGMVLGDEFFGWYVHPFKNNWEKTAEVLREWQKDFWITTAYIEAVGAMRRDKPRTAFIFGKNTGIITGMLYLAKIPFVEVHSQKWQKFHKLGAKYESSAERKNAHKAHVQEILPEIKWTLQTADAGLIASYAFDKELG